MGAGLAKQFKLRIPSLDARYRSACRSKILEIGKPFVLYMNGDAPNIILFPTKDHWRHPSKLSWIDTGLAYLSERIVNDSKMSIATPPLGCGLGGLDWNEVHPLIEQHLGGVKACILVYALGRRSAS
jgi:hypothetical protein